MRFATKVSVYPKAFHFAASPRLISSRNVPQYEVCLSLRRAMRFAEAFVLADTTGVED